MRFALLLLAAAALAQPPKPEPPAVPDDVTLDFDVEYSRVGERVAMDIFRPKTAGPHPAVLAVHGGGYLPAYMGRMDHAWGARRDARGILPKPPSHYLRKMYFDALVFNSLQVDFLIRAFGADHIMLGTDYPFDMGEYNPVQHLRSVASLTAADRRNVGGETAARLFGLKIPPQAEQGASS